MPILLKGGFQTEDIRLDRVPQFDPRSKNFPAIRGTSLEQRVFRSYTWNVPYVLDQGTEGRCVEYSICHELLARPSLVPKEEVDRILAGREIYWPAQEDDIWPGGSYPGADPQYEGTSVLSGVKVAARLGFYPQYHWAFGVEELARAVGYKGPACLGVNWYEGFYNTDERGWISIGNSSLSGGHAIVCIGVQVVGKPPNYERSCFILQNSWGKDWGQHGRCRISWADMRRLLEEDGECCLPDLRSRQRASA